MNEENIVIHAQPLLLCDPPQGEKFGFPKPIPEEVLFNAEEGSIEKWLVENGYPQKIIDDMGDEFYCEFYDEEDSED